MTACGESHVDTGQQCRVEGHHAFHVAGFGSARVEWENEDFGDPHVPRKVGGGTAKLNEVAHKVRGATRHDDSVWNSALANEATEPKRGTRQAKVLAVLREAQGGWVDGHVLASAEVGGTEGLRRCRELRVEHGLPIERRPHPTKATAWQYRLAMSKSLSRNFD